MGKGVNKQTETLQMLPNKTNLLIIKQEGAENVISAVFLLRCLSYIATEHSAGEQVPEAFSCPPGSSLCDKQARFLSGLGYNK